jgi:hypothetical protein
MLTAANIVAELCSGDCAIGVSKKAVGVGNRVSKECLVAISKRPAVNFALSGSTARAVIAAIALILSANWSTRNDATEAGFCPARDATATGVGHFKLLVGVENMSPEGM